MASALVDQTLQGDQFGQVFFDHNGARRTVAASVARRRPPRASRRRKEWPPDDTAAAAAWSATGAAGSAAKEAGHRAACVADVRRGLAPDKRRMSAGCWPGVARPQPRHSI